jgi:hypothetical protein
MSPPLIVKAARHHLVIRFTQKTEPKAFASNGQLSHHLSCGCQEHKPVCQISTAKHFQAADALPLKATLA